MLKVAEALQRILETAAPLPARWLPLDQALGLRLAEDLRARESQPHFANSAMDGYALGSLTAECLRVGEVAAGQVPDFKLNQGQCCRIFTGAPLPEGCVAVVPQEEAETTGDRVKFHGPIQPGQHMRAAGEHFSQGEIMLVSGRLLSPANLGLAALLGYPRVLCQPRARVALLATGDELVELDQPLGPAQVRNSNLYALQAQARGCGAEVHRQPIVPDRPEAVRHALEQALEGADAVITCGGASVGDRDYVQGVLQEMGADLQLWKVAMRPGKPLGFALLGNKPIVALPGNPVSCFVGFELFVRPLLDVLQGGPGRGLSSSQARLGQAVTKKKGLRFFYRFRQHQGQVLLAGSQDSHLFRSIAESDGLLELDEEIEALPEGSTVKVLWWPWVKAPEERA